MPQGFQAVLALLVLLPGFVSARIARSISSPAEQTDIERIIDALVFSFYIYLFYLFLFGANLSFALNFSADAVRLGNYGVRVFFWRLLYLCIAPPVLGVLWGALEHRDSLLGFLRWIKFTDRTNDVTVWNGTLKALSGTVQVGLGDDREIAGWLQRYSDIGAERSLFWNALLGSGQMANAQRYLALVFC